jgi:glycine cleavage system H protein
MSSDDYPDELKYTKDHEWARIDGNLATVGITAYAAEQLGDITQIDLPKEGENVRKGAVIATVESVKAVSDIFAPISGKIVKVNTPLVDTPEYISEDPYDEGWMFQIEVGNAGEVAELMDAEAYQQFLQESE